MMNKVYIKEVVMLLTVVLFLINTALPIFADSDPLPAPDWVTVTDNSDGSKTLTVQTPSYMLDVVSYYEYSTDSGLTWKKINDNAGGEFVFDSTTEFTLVYISDGFRSTAYTTTVEINKYTPLSSSTGVILLIPFDSELPADISLATYEIIGGTDHNFVSEYAGEDKAFLLFNVLLLSEGQIYENTITNLWFFPTGDMNASNCSLYHISSEGEITLIESEAELNILACLTDKTGLFAVIEDKSVSSSLRGDVNGDGAVTATDARLVLRCAAKLEELTSVQSSAADVNSDGNITSADARTILRISAKLEE